MVYAYSIPYGLTYHQVPDVPVKMLISLYKLNAMHCCKTCRDLAQVSQLRSKACVMQGCIFPYLVTQRDPKRFLVTEIFEALNKGYEF